MELTETQAKKLQTIGKRLCSAHRGARTQLNKHPRCFEIQKWDS